MKNIFSGFKKSAAERTAQTAGRATRSSASSRKSSATKSVKSAFGGLFKGKSGKQRSQYVTISKFKLKKKYLVITLAAVLVAVPVIIATAASSNQVAVIGAIDLEAFSVSETVIADDESDLFAGVANDAEIASQEKSAEAAAQVQAEPTPEPEPVYVEYKLGDEAAFVADIQQRLMDLYYMERDEPTTLYGPMTSQAILYFQRKNELAQDGVAGIDTQKLLFSDEARYYTVSEGAEGPDVETIQERLSELGYGVSGTGYFGSDTTKAVEYFQRMNGLTDDGNVGSETKEILFSTTAEPSLEYGKKKSSSSSGKSSSSSGGGGGNSTNVTANPGSVSAFISAAESMAGVPYVRGGKSTSGVDCSGLVYVALQLSGNGIGYMTSGGWASSGYPTVYSMGELQAGDVVCFSGHVGIYLGGGSMIDASSSQGCVRYCSDIQSSNYWTSNFICGKRPL